MKSYALTINGNALHIPLADRSVQCCITSPPYYGLRDFGTAKWVGGDPDCEHFQHTGGPNPKRYSVGGGEMFRKSNERQYSLICGNCGAERHDQQLGIELTPIEYIENMVTVFREVRRVLRDDGTVWLNMGDTYAHDRPRGHYGDQGDLSTGAHGEKIPVRDWSCWNLKKKDLVGMPWRVALALQSDGAADPAHMETIRRMIAAISKSYDTRAEWPDLIRAEVERLEREWIDAHRGGWWLRSDIIWHKPNPMPGSAIDRPANAHEYVFLLTKSAKYYYDYFAIREKSANTEHTRERYKYKPSAAKKHAENKDTNISNIDFAEYFVSDGYRNKRSVWTIAPESYSEAHFAAFPQKLVEPMILGGTSEAGCCPECGNPWKRILKKIVLPPPDRQNNNLFKTYHEGRHGTGKSTLRMMVRRETIGFEPTCWHGIRHPIPQAELDADPSLLDDYETEPYEPVGCLVLDPFSGTSVVGRVAVKHRRRFIGVELNPEYIKMAQKRTSNVQVTLPFDLNQGKMKWQLGGEDGN